MNLHAAVLAALVIVARDPCAAPAARGVLAPRDSVVITDTLRLYYMGHAIGRERYELAAGVRGYRLTADFDYLDRGRRTHIAGSARTAPDFTPELLEIRRLSDTSSRVETRVEVQGGRATVLASGKTTEVVLPSVAFAIAAHAPVTQHLLLLRYWLAHGRPRTLAVVPGGPTNVVSIEWRGRDTLQRGASLMVLDRYAVDGVVWGLESVWLDGAGRLAAITTRAGHLTLEAVREELAPLYPRLMAISTRDRMADLARLSRKVVPIASGGVAHVGAASPGPTGTIALLGATLIDGGGGPPVADAAVVVAGGRIVAAGPRSSVTVPRGARNIDVHGKTIIPGLWDMHTHLTQMELAPLYLAAGITTVRDMGNELDLIVPLRAAVDSGGALGPHMLLAGLVDGGGPDAFGAVNATTAEEARAVVRMYHDLRFEQMKLYTLLTPTVVGATVREAHRLGMTVTGHVPASLTLLAAVDSGMDHIAHQPVRGDAASDSVRHVIELLHAHGTVIDPTASWGELLGRPIADPLERLIPGVPRLPPVLEQWARTMGSAAVDSATAEARMRRTLATLRALHQGGVPLVAGTDGGVPGLSLYREVELYALAGMSPMDAIRAATAVSAHAMRLERETGTIEQGKRADLIVLDANPLEAIGNIRTVRYVMKGGVMYSSAELWRSLGGR
ncbi:MAG TPA: amidohydrolase family protein [Gemmatimonadaceae bacterium]|nr:amidohydrolase family protein [Gemmatimonadaceae bacterium]